MRPKFKRNYIYCACKFSPATVKPSAREHHHKSNQMDQNSFQILKTVLEITVNHAFFP